MTPLACLMVAYAASLSLGGFVAVRRIFWWLDRG
jgi:hypothetical protein